MREDIVAQGLELMLYGMGTVVMFLALLVLATTIMSSMVTRFFPQQEVAPVAVRTSSKRLPAEAGTELDPAVVAAITAAIHQHRSNRK